MIDPRRALADAPAGATLARWALGAAILLAGAHKLLAPAAWNVYVVDALAAVLVVSPTAFTLANGVLELGFGAALLADRGTPVAAAVVAVSLSATCVYLAAVWATAGRFGDVLVRDVGLTGLAWAVTVESVRDAVGGSAGGDGDRDGEGDGTSLT